MSHKKHKRVIRRGTETFEEGSDCFSDVKYDDNEKSQSDDNRILSELPPHWAIFSGTEKDYLS